MQENRNAENGQNNEEVRREDLKQKTAPTGVDETRTGSTGDAINAPEWKLNDEERNTTADPETGSTGNNTNNQ